MQLFKLYRRARIVNTGPETKSKIAENVMPTFFKSNFLFMKRKLFFLVTRIVLGIRIG